MEGLKYSLQISTLDCTGCEVCVNTCPGKKGEKALKMVPISEALEKGQAEKAKYFFDEVTYKDYLVDKMANPKNSQFAQPLFEFSGACGGCGETPYVKLATQLFGDHMVIANATGCSSIYGGSFPATPYTKIKMVMDLLGLIHYLKIMLNSVLVWLPQVLLYVIKLQLIWKKL